MVEMHTVRSFVHIFTKAVHIHHVHAHSKILHPYRISYFECHAYERLCLIFCASIDRPFELKLNIRTVFSPPFRNHIACVLITLLITGSQLYLLNFCLRYCSIMNLHTLSMIHLNSVFVSVTCYIPFIS